MEKSIFEQMGGTYHKQGDYYLPDFAVPGRVPVGIWGQRHLQYIREYHKALYTSLQLSGELNSYLADIDQQAQNMFSRLVRQMVEQERITEHLKVKNQMKWVGRMNNIKNRVEEIVCKELVYG